MGVRIVTFTPDPEYVIGYCARASSPKNQERMEKGELTAAGLLKFCAEHGHWSVFEMANVVMEIHTSRAISAQLLRHKSFSFQEFSQRYAQVQRDKFKLPEMRKAHKKNRQSSTDKIDDKSIESLVNTSVFDSLDAYEFLINQGVAPECARMLLPMCSPTKLYMNGTIRSWIHYLAVRCKEDTQKEHREIALAIRGELSKILPTCAEAFDWK